MKPLYSGIYRQSTAKRFSCAITCSPIKVAAAATCIALVMLVSCSTVRQVRPLARRESSATLSVGGPFTGQLAWIPIPMLGIGYNYGLLDSMLDIEAGWYIMSALYGVMHVDIGVNWRPWLSRSLRPGLIVSPKVFLLTDFTPESFRAYPDLNLTAVWQVRAFWDLYAGIENWFEPHKERSDGLKQQHHWLPAPYIGVNMGRNKWQFQLEGRLYTPNLENTYRATQNIGIGDYGMWGIFIGVKRTFGSGRGG